MGNEKTIKICHMTSAHRSNDIRIFEKECVSLAKKKKYKVFLVAEGDSYNRKNVYIEGTGSVSYGRLRRMTSGAKRIYQKALELDADIYHFHDPELLPYAKKLKKKGKLVIFDSHEDVAEQIKGKQYIPKWLRTLISNVYVSYQNRVVKKLDVIISVTPHICERLQKINPRTFMVTNFPILCEVSKAKAMKEGKVVFAGGVTDQWSHQYIIKAIEELSGVTYDIYGKAGGPEYIQKLARLKGWEKVNYRGFQPFEVVQEEIQTANVAMALCQYSENTAGRYGTLGNTKLFEAMQLGVPVIATDFVLWKEIIDKYQCGIYVSPEDVKGIRKAIHYLCTDINAAKKMGMNGRQAVVKKYNWGHEERTLFQIYQMLEKEITGDI